MNDSAAMSGDSAATPGVDLDAFRRLAASPPPWEVSEGTDSLCSPRAREHQLREDHAASSVTHPEPELTSVQVVYVAYKEAASTAAGEPQPEPEPEPTSSDASDLGAAMEAIFREHNPRKLKDLPKLLQEWAGNEGQLLANIELKYLGSTLRPETPQVWRRSVAATTTQAVLTEQQSSGSWTGIVEPSALDALRPSQLVDEIERLLLEDAPSVEVLKADL